MQPVLPTNLDRTSTQVLGFDAAAYINDTKSTLHQRLNIPGSFNSADYLAGSLAKPQQRKKSNAAAVAAGIIGTFGLGMLAFFGIKKGKIKLPEKLASKLPDTKKLTPSIRKTFENVKNSAGEFFKKVFKKSSKTKPVTEGAKKSGFDFKGIKDSVFKFFKKVFKKGK